jgi:iron complex transport system substrate-binding protein
VKKLVKSLSLVLTVFIVLSVILCGCDTSSKGKEISSEGSRVEGTNVEETTVEKNDIVSEINRPEFIKNETESDITIIDPLENEVTLAKNPKRVVSLYASYLDLWYEVGGKAIASVSPSSGTLPEGVEDLGKMSSVSPEKILALQPDLVIMANNMKSQVALKDILEENKIPYLYIQYDLYQDYIETLDLMSRLNGTEEQIAGKVKTIEDEINTIIEQTKGKKAPKVLIMFTTSKTVSCEVSTGTTGNMVELLGGENIVKDIPVEDKTRVDFSMESIAVEDPDMIFIKTMGDVDACKELMKKDIESNEAWAAMRAVKEDKIYYLDKDLFLNKPNERFPEAFEILAGYMYQDK